jgi:hypothetical protein
MPRKYLAALVLAGVVLLPNMAAAQDAKTPALVVRTQSVETIVSKIKHVAKAIGKEAYGKQVEAFVKAQANGQGPEAIDVKKPMGLYVKPNADWTNGAVVWMLPVKNEQSFLKALMQLNQAATKNEDGSYSIDQGIVPLSIGFRFANGYVYLAGGDLAAITPANLVAPAEIFPANAAAKSLLSAVLRMDRMPKSVKDEFIRGVTKSLNEEKERIDKEGKTPAEKIAAKKTMDAFAQQMTDFVLGVKEVALHFNIEEPANTISVEMTLEAVKNSKLSKTITSLGKFHSPFAGILKQDADVTELVRFVLPNDLKKVLTDTYDQAVRQAVMGEVNPANKVLAGKFFAAIRPTLQMGELQVALVGRMHEGGTATVLAGIKVVQGMKLDEVFRMAYKSMPPQEKAKVKLDVAKVGLIKIHELNVSDNLDPNTKKLFGGGPMYFAFRNDAMFFAFGPEGLTALTQAVTAPAGQATKMLIYQAKMGKLLPFFLENDKQKHLAKRIFSKDPGLVTFTVEGGTMLRIQGSMSISVLEFIAAIAPVPLEVQLKDEQPR